MERPARHWSDRKRGIGATNIRHWSDRKYFKTTFLLQYSSLLKKVIHKPRNSLEIFYREGRFVSTRENKSLRTDFAFFQQAPSGALEESFIPRNTPDRANGKKKDCIQNGVRADGGVTVPLTPFLWANSSRSWLRSNERRLG